ncbi:hypothetical protein THAOC_15403 [Thalassiosira oceanica]|uniref:BZIP domain-containing protein n=1 Tax=Thalassiosira oceanica TaxID=159749 RepID=K0SCQ0_THAOC|nr:hypothetical protein THAOC_15403 [Thalassiosira oceanica]|eukprot:EJK63913.1 hypothetical protein THAOC_15403 [Thalassiosira oceanica]
MRQPALLLAALPRLSSVATAVAASRAFVQLWLCCRSVLCVDRTAMTGCIILSPHAHPHRHAAAGMGTRVPSWPTARPASRAPGREHGITSLLLGTSREAEAEGRAVRLLCCAGARAGRQARQCNRFTMTKRLSTASSGTSSSSAAAAIQGKKRKMDSGANDRAKHEYAGHKLPSDLTDRRRVRNMLSAKVHRKRKQDALNTAKTELDECNTTISKLKQQLSAVSPIKCWIFGPPRVTRSFPANPSDVHAQTRGKITALELALANINGFGSGLDLTLLAEQGLPRSQPIPRSVTSEELSSDDESCDTKESSSSSKPQIVTM